MARTLAALPAGSRITDYISLGVVTRFFPRERIDEVLQRTGRASQRERDLPAHVVVYYVIALALYMRSSYREVLRCLLEGVQWLMNPSASLKVAGKSGISQARSRLGAEPVKALYEAVVAPMAGARTKGAWFHQWRLMSLDGSTLDVADTAENDAAFGRPGASRGNSAYPKIRFVALLENGTHVLCAARMGKYSTDELTLAQDVVPALAKGMLCLADRFFPSYQLWQLASQTKADLLWRTRQNARLEVDHRLAPARELAAIYHERWEIENALDELKTHLRGAQIVLRSKTPELVQQEFYGLLMAHYAVRGLMHEAALRADEDPDRLSFLHAVRVVQRRVGAYGAIPPSAQETLS